MNLNGNVSIRERRSTMLRRKRRAHDDSFKARVAIEAIKEIKTVSEIASEYTVHPTQVSAWKSELLGKSASIFSGNKKEHAKIEELEKEQELLHQQIGRQAMELEFAKKNCRKLGLM